MTLYGQALQMIGNMYAMMDKLIGTEGFPYTHEEVLSLMEELRKASEASDEITALLQKGVDEREGRRGLSAHSKAFAQSVLREGKINTRIRELIVEMTKEKS